MSKVALQSDLVSVEWLNNHLLADNLVVLNATIPKVTGLDNSKFEKQIPNTLFFDIKKKFSNTQAPFPNTVPSEKQFQEQTRLLGINTNTVIIVYDEKGIYSSARAWWLFKSFGHTNVAVLNGGLPEWASKGYVVEKKSTVIPEHGNFKASFQSNTIISIETLHSISENKSHKIIDARSNARFNCEIEEPRAGLRRGTIPGSINIPFKNLLENGKLMPKSQLKAIFTKSVSNNQSLIFSCGSGITACVLALGATLSGYENISIYDGSWTEYGTLIT